MLALTVEFWGKRNLWCPKLGGTDEEFCPATAGTAELEAILGSPVELCSVLGGTVLGVEIDEVRLLVPLTKGLNVA